MSSIFSTTDELHSSLRSQSKVNLASNPEQSNNSVTVSAPINPNIAPPGYYMIHVLNGTGVPSVAKIIRLPGINNPETFYNVSIPGNKAAALNVGGSTRYGEEALNASSIIVGKSLKSWKVRLRKSGTPSGIITAKIRRKSDDSVVAYIQPNNRFYNIGDCIC